LNRSIDCRLANLPSNNIRRRKIKGLTGDHGSLGIDLEALVSHLENVVELTYSLKVSQDKEPRRLERVVEYWEQLLLQSWPKIDQQVPADDQVKLRKRRVRRDVLLGEDTHPANRLVYLVGAVRFVEKAWCT